MTDKPKALMLADSLEHQVFHGSYNWERVEPMMLKAAKELRRLHNLLGKANELLGASGEREAIVKECASIILNNDIEKQEHYDINSPFFAGWERGVIDSAQIIKQHFGIEE